MQMCAHMVYIHMDVNAHVCAWVPSKLTSQAVQQSNGKEREEGGQ